MSALGRAGERVTARLKCRVDGLFVATICALFSAGCGSTEVHQIFMRQASLQSRHDVEVYVTGAPLHRAYYDVAILQAVGHGSNADVEHVTHAIANRAARLGCDAVVRLHVELGVTRAHATGVCVNWASAAAEAVPAPSPSSSAPATPAAPTTPAPQSPSPAPTDASGGTSI